MKTIKFIPKVVTGYTVEGATVAPTFSGHIELRVPNYFERQQLKALMVNAVVQGGESDIESIKGATSKKVDVLAMIKSMVAMVEASMPFYVSVEMKKLSNGAEYKSFDDLSFDPEAEGILQEAAQELANGLQLSKN